MIETQKLIVLSTSHLSGGTMYKLRRQEIYAFYYSLEHGRWLMRLPQKNNFYDTDLRRIYEFAKKLGANWILFDERAECIAELKKYR